MNLFARFIRLFVVLLFPAAAPAQDWAALVNPLIGTGGHGHTFPGATRPFGMVQLSPDTRVEGWDACGGYYYADSTILGFSHTHLSGTGVADYGDILVMPGVFPAGNPVFTGLASPFRHTQEKCSPGYYSVRLDRFSILAELTATERVGVHRYTFPSGGTAQIVVDLTHGLGPDHVISSGMEIVSDSEITGFRRSTGWAKDQYIYFDAVFSQPFLTSGIAVNDTLRFYDRSVTGTDLKGVVLFPGMSHRVVTVKIGLSAVSVAEAGKNIAAEAPDWKFDAIAKSAREEWNKNLGKIAITGGTPAQRTTFYTALYHAMIAPNAFSDADGSYRGMDGKIHTAAGFTMHTVFSLWDTFRAEHPLLTIIDQKRTLDFVRSLLAKYDESGNLPVWELASNETWCMIGYHAVPVIADAAAKHIGDIDLHAALAAMRHSAERDGAGLKSYRDGGYVDGGIESESVSKTLEYAYDDWCISSMAGLAGDTAAQREFSRRAGYYENLFDAGTGLMRPKVNGMWLEPFDPTSVMNQYTEANAWQYSFFVPQDIDGLIDMAGGREAFVRKLDTLFTTTAGLTGRDQADITGMIGQYAHGNEPSHHVAYLYNYAGAPWKTQYYVHRILDSLYRPEPDGLCGNDDCGQMSAWYVMSALGLYEVCPGEPVYCIGSPLFPKASMHLENGKTFVISANGAATDRPYIQSSSLNKAAYAKSFITHADLMKGGELALTMGSSPNLRWAQGGEPRSPGSAKIAATPFVRGGAPQFSDSLRISLECSTPGAVIHFTTDGTNPAPESPVAPPSILLTKTMTVKALAMAPGLPESRILTSDFRQFHPVGRIRLQTGYDAQYTGGGPNALTDGIRGKADFRLGGWQGYHGVDLDAVLDLDSVKDLKHVSLGCLQDVTSWIFFPDSVGFSFSVDGMSFGKSIDLPNTVSQHDAAVTVRDFGTDLPSGTRARYVRVKAKNIGRCPPWHPGAGEKAWLFVDEISVDAK